MRTRFFLARRALRAGATFILLAPATAWAQRQNGLLVGRVLTGDIAVPNATILVSGGRVTLARVDGRYRMSLPAGRYEVRAQRLGFTSGRDSVEIVAGQTATTNFRLARAISALEVVAAVGTRGYERSVVDVPQPVDVIDGPALRTTGRMQTSRALQATAPGVHVPRPTVGEGSDVVQPVSLRGLGPDQVLVLVNGRRRHGSALMNVNGTSGHGSTGVDLDAIPSSMIERIEVLRGGMMAQYGADAVAGVINVVLKSGVHGDAVTMVGGNVTTYNRTAGAPGDAPASGTYGAARNVRDGRSVLASIDKGVVFGERGFLHGDLQYREREFTNRALPDPRLQYPAGDPRATQTGVSQDVVSHRSGDPATRDLSLFLNGGNLLASGLELYGNLGLSRRALETASLFRRAVDPVTNTTDYPSGFLPIIRPTIDDQSGTVGLRGSLLDDWRYDLATTYGRNVVDYAVLNTQTSGGTAGASFDAGRVRFGQSTTNLDLFRSLSYFDELRLAAGAELRSERYGIDQAPAALDIEGFPGFGPAQAVAASRTDLAGYLDLEADLVPSLLAGIAGRLERTSDMGTLPSVNLSLRFEPSRRFALRASVGRAERAPSLAQLNYGTFATEPGVSGVPSNVTRNAPGSMPGALGLRPERSTTVSAGVAVEPSASFSISADLYQAAVDDRVTLLQGLTDAAPASPYYSANAADTRTRGVDVTANYGIALNSRGAALRFMAGMNAHRTEVLRALAVGDLGLGRVGITRLEKGQPSSSVIASATYAKDALGALLRTQRFGEVTVAGLQGGASLDQTFGARWVTDANLSYTLARKYTFTVGADNLLDVYPARGRVPGDATTGARGNGYFGILPYGPASPFGANGRFVYGRLSLYL